MRVVREHIVRARKRIDLVVFHDTARFLCVIENKIHTGEHSEQLGIYREAIGEHYPGYSCVFVFLTLKNEKPSDPAYIGMTYKELGEVLASVAGNPPRFSPEDAKACLFRHYVSFVREGRSTAPRSLNIFDALRLREIKHSDFWAAGPAR